MMNKIEKMYENANIALKRCSECDNDMDCDYGKGCYPLFTAEKQLNIIKFLGKTRDFHTCGRYCTALNSEGDSVESLQDKFEVSLAGLINELWQDMSEKEKQQIKEILE